MTVKEYRTIVVTGRGARHARRLRRQQLEGGHAQLDRRRRRLFALAPARPAARLTPLVTSAKNVEGLQFPELAPMAIELAAAVRAQGAQVVVLLVHAGAGCTCLADPKTAETCEATDLSTCSVRSE